MSRFIQTALDEASITSTQDMLSTDDDDFHYKTSQSEAESQDDDAEIEKELHLHKLKEQRFNPSSSGDHNTNLITKNLNLEEDDNFSHATDYSYISDSSTGLANLPANKKIKLNDAFKLKFFIEENSDVMCCKILKHRLFLGLASGTVKVYATNRTTGGLSCVYILEDADTFKNTITSLSFCHLGGSRDSNSQAGASSSASNEDSQMNDEPLLVCSYVNGMIKFWHISGSQCLSTIAEHDSEALVCTVSNNSRYMYTAGDRKIVQEEGTLPNYTINKYDIETRKLVSVFGNSLSKNSMDGHVRRIYSLRMNPANSHSFISAGWDDTVQFWDDRVKHNVRKIAGPHICSETGLDISSDGKEILAASWRRLENLQAFDFGTGKLLKTYSTTHKTDPYNSYSCCFLDSRTVSVGTSSSNSYIMFDRNHDYTPKGEVPNGIVSNLPGGVYSFDHCLLGNLAGARQMKLDPRSRLVAIASSNNVYLCQQNRKVLYEGEEMDVMKT